MLHGSGANLPEGGMQNFDCNKMEFLNVVFLQKPAKKNG